MRTALDVVLGISGSGIWCSKDVEKLKSLFDVQMVNVR
jgi:hypothetical protein